jgi:hypothetical protein
MLIVTAAVLLAVCGCQKEIKEIRTPDHAAPVLAQR